MIEILRALSGKFPLYLFSNQTEINVVYLKAILKPYFKYMLFSNEVKMHKPDKQVFKLLINHMETSLKDALYIDDNREPLEIAKKYEMSTYHFTTVTQLKEDLQKLLLL